MKYIIEYCYQYNTQQHYIRKYINRNTFYHQETELKESQKLFEILQHLVNPEQFELISNNSEDRFYYLITEGSKEDRQLQQHFKGLFEI